MDPLKQPKVRRWKVKGGPLGIEAIPGARVVRRSQWAVRWPTGRPDSLRPKKSPGITPGAFRAKGVLLCDCCWSLDWERRRESLSVPGRGSNWAPGHSRDPGGQWVAKESCWLSIEVTPGSPSGFLLGCRSLEGEAPPDGGIRPLHRLQDSGLVRGGVSSRCVSWDPSGAAASPSGRPFSCIGSNGSMLIPSDSEGP